MWPENIPFAIPWEELEKKIKVPASVKRIRGKLNVPGERFQVTEDRQYIQARPLEQNKRSRYLFRQIDAKAKKASGYDLSPEPRTLMVPSPVPGPRAPLARTPFRAVVIPTPA